MQHSTILILPGWQDSGPQHWQSLWLKKYPNAVKVTQADWMYPKKDEWVKGLNDAIAKHRGHDIALVGHSLANATIAWWAKEYFSNTHAHINGALLVSPSDVEAPDLPKEITGFTPMPLDPLQFKSIVVASEDDPYVTMDRAKYFAQRWGGSWSTLAHTGISMWPRAMESGQKERNYCNNYSLSNMSSLEELQKEMFAISTLTVRFCKQRWLQTRNKQ